MMVIGALGVTLTGIYLAETLDGRWQISSVVCVCMCVCLGWDCGSLCLTENDIIPRPWASIREERKERWEEKGWEARRNGRMGGGGLWFGIVVSWREFTVLSSCFLARQLSSHWVSETPPSPRPLSLPHWIHQAFLSMRPVGLINKTWWTSLLQAHVRDWLT